MILHHTTTLERSAQISLRGILPAMSRGKLRASWLHAETKSAWAMLHVLSRHKASLNSVVRLTVNVPRSWLRRSRRGLWYCTRDIPPSRIVGKTYLEEVSRSPIEECAA